MEGGNSKSRGGEGEGKSSDDFPIDNFFGAPGVQEKGGKGSAGEEKEKGKPLSPLSIPAGGQGGGENSEKGKGRESSLTLEIFLFLP